MIAPRPINASLFIVLALLALLFSSACNSPEQIDISSAGARCEKLEGARKRVVVEGYLRQAGSYSEMADVGLASDPAAVDDDIRVNMHKGKEADTIELFGSGNTSTTDYKVTYTNYRVHTSDGSSATLGDRVQIVGDLVWISSSSQCLLYAMRILKKQ